MSNTSEIITAIEFHSMQEYNVSKMSVYNSLQSLNASANIDSMDEDTADWTPIWTDDGMVDVSSDEEPSNWDE